MTHSIIAGPFNAAQIIFDPGDVDMDVGTIPLPVNFDMTVNDIPATITGINWITGTLLNFDTDDAQGAGQMHLVYHTSSNLLNNLDGIRCEARQQHKVAF